MDKRKKQIPKYDIIETINIIENPEVDIINKAIEDLKSLIKERVNSDGYNRSNLQSP